MRSHWVPFALSVWLLSCTTSPTPTPTALPSLIPTALPATPTATAMPVEGRILLSSAAGDIIALDPDGDNQQALFTSPGLDRYPSVSADGRWLAFSSDMGGNEDIYLLNLLSRELTQVTDDPAVDTQPFLSPGGDWLAFVSDREGSLDVFSYDIHADRIEPLADGSGDQYAPQVSPDGSAVLFLNDQDGVVELYRIGADGRGQAQLTNNAVTELSPYWTADGRIAYLDGETAVVRYLDANGRPRGEAAAIDLPDVVSVLDSVLLGRSLALVADEDANASLYLVADATPALLAEAHLDGGLFWSELPPVPHGQPALDGAQIELIESGETEISSPVLALSGPQIAPETPLQIRFTHWSSGYQVQQFVFWPESDTYQLPLDLPRDGLWLIDVWLDAQFMQAASIVIE